MVGLTSMLLLPVPLMQETVIADMTSTAEPLKVPKLTAGTEGYKSSHSKQSLRHEV